MLGFHDRMKLLKKYWWVILVIIAAFTIFPAVTTKPSPFKGEWKEENTNVTWSFGSTGYDTTNEQGLITYQGDYSYNDKEITCISHPAGNPNVKHSVTYSYRFEGSKLYFDNPIHLEFSKIQ